MSVSEAQQEVALVVRRTKGTFGAVSVFCFAQNTREGAVRGEDFSFDPMVQQVFLYFYKSDFWL